MLLLRGSSVCALCLTLVMGLGLSWPSLIHYTLHERAAHGHDHHDAEVPSSNSALEPDPAAGNNEHPHLELTTRRPTESGLHLVVLFSDVVSLELPALFPVRSGITVTGSTGPRSPPGTPPPSIRAPPIA